MTTYPLSEPATIRRTARDGNALSQTDEVVGHGSLARCADLLQKLSTEERSSLRIDVDDMKLRYGAEEIEELLIYLRDESGGLSDRQISKLTDPDR
jgi:hypothetical protein